MVDHRPPVAGVCRALSTAGSSLRRARVWRQSMVIEVGRRWVGSQGERLLEAAGAGAGAVPARQRQELVPGVAAVPRTAGTIFLAHVGRQAVGIPRPAAGKARLRLAGERSGLTVTGQQAARRLVGAIGGARLREAVVVFVSRLCVRPLSAEQRVISECGVLW